MLSRQYVVFDECDRLFEMGFAAELRSQHTPMHKSCFKIIIIII